MLTKKNFFLWIDIKEKTKRGFTFPVALIVVEALIETIVEVFAVLALVFPHIKIKNQNGKVIMTMKEFEIVLNVIDEMMSILKYEHQLELVEVHSKEAHVSIVLK